MQFRRLGDSEIEVSEICLGSFLTYGEGVGREQTEACYPQLKTVLAEKRRIDPEEKLVNAWYLHHRSLLGRTSCAERWNR